MTTDLAKPKTKRELAITHNREAEHHQPLVPGWVSPLNQRSHRVSI